MTIKEKRELQELKRKLARVEKELGLRKKTPLGQKVSRELNKRIDKLEKSMKELKELGRGMGIKGLKKILRKLEKGS
ncbi:hypothetical protein IIA15_08840 [candidate division TA06 bacterium]|nr:hypothetical protein [candidate division TA06 bacterium]